jgi:hypothetical protein
MHGHNHQFVQVTCTFRHEESQVSWKR